MLLNIIMNFNLISPTTNGNDYTINFKDPITIAPNAKVSLNFCELQRTGDIELSKDAAITISALGILPNQVPSDGTSTADDFERTITIPKGKYSFSQIQTKLTEAVSQVFEEGESNYGAYEPTNDDSTNDIVIGAYAAENEVIDLDFDSVNKYFAAQVTTGGAEVAYTTNATITAPPSFNNYALSSKHLDFYRGNYLPDTKDYNNVAQLKSIGNISAQTGRIMFGLYSPEYAQGINTAPTRTNGNSAPLLDANGIPKCFVSVVCNAQTVDIYYARSAVGPAFGRRITDWPNINQEISDMDLIVSVPTSTVFDVTSPFDILFGLEIDNKNPLSKITVKVAAYQNAKYLEIYNSTVSRSELPNSLLVGTSGITYDDANSRNSQIPFTLFVSSDTPNEGWAECEYSFFDKLNGRITPGGYSNDNPNLIITNYEVSITEPLASALGLNAKPSTYKNLHPNQGPLLADYLRVEASINWKSANYSLFINLPTNNYKNVSNQRDGGFKKSILANIPSPFTTGAIIESQGTDAGQVTSIYQPYTPILNNLKNNELQINTLSIKIVDMLTEEPSTEIKRSIVNFTIHD